MDYARTFAQSFEVLKAEGRYRIFVDIRRACGEFPRAEQFVANGTRPITVWCSNDYLGMGQHANGACRNARGASPCLTNSTVQRDKKPPDLLNFDSRFPSRVGTEI
jgi:7-keto-8-aminopelargonate synthetase-like enzyme